MNELLFLGVSVLVLGACLPSTDAFVVADGPEVPGGPGVSDAGLSPLDAASPFDAAGQPQDAAIPAEDSGLPEQCQLSPTCTEECSSWMLITTLAVPGCGGVVLRHSLKSEEGDPGGCLCDSYAGLFPSEITDALFFQPDTMIVAGEGHIANIDTDSGETRWVHELTPGVTRRLEPAAAIDEVLIIEGEQSQGPVRLRRLGDGGQTRSIPPETIQLTSLVANYVERGHLLGLSMDGEIRSFDVSNRQVASWDYDVTNDSPIVRLESSQGYSMTNITAVHANNTLSSNSTTASALLRGCTDGPQFQQATSILTGFKWAAVTAEGTPPLTELYLRIDGEESCSVLLSPEDFPETFTLRRVRSVWPRLR